MAQAHIRSRGPGNWQLITPQYIDPNGRRRQRAETFHGTKEQAVARVAQLSASLKNTELPGHTAPTRQKYPTNRHIQTRASAALLERTTITGEEQELLENYLTHLNVLGEEGTHPDLETWYQEVRYARGRRAPRTLQEVSELRFKAVLDAARVFKHQQDASSN